MREYLSKTCSAAAAAQLPYTDSLFHKGQARQGARHLLHRVYFMKKCVKACPAQTISLEGVKSIDHEKCIAFGPGCNEVCVDGCPTGILHRTGQAPIAKRGGKAVVAE